jgi:hypothetical protein
VNKEMVEIQDYAASQKGKGQELKQDVTTSISSRRLSKPATARRDDFLWMDRRQRKLPTTKEENPVS